MPAWLEAILEIVKALAPVATALIALRALRNWQRQDKAKREAEFLDALIEAAHTYIAEISAPVTLVEMARIGIVSHAPTESTEPTVEGAIAYIQKDGERSSKRLHETLDAMQQSTIRLRSLAAKGQVFDFKKYYKCQNAIKILTWHFDRMEGFMGILGSPTLNWQNSEILQTLKKIIEIDPNNIRKSIDSNYIDLMGFTRETYKRIYG